MSSILDALGKVEGSAPDNSGHDGPPTRSSSEGPPPDGPPQGPRVGRRPRWVIVVLVSGLGLALGVAVGRFLGDSQVTPVLVVEATKVSPKTPLVPKASKAGAWPRVPRARSGLPPELTRHPGATRVSPWPVVPVAKPTAPAVVDRPVPKVVAGDGLAGLVAAREKALAEGGEEGLKNFDDGFVALVAVAKKAPVPAVAKKAPVPAVAKKAPVPAAAKKAPVPAAAKKAPVPAVARPVPKAAAGGDLAGLAAAREKALAEGGAEGLKNFDKAFPAFAAAAKKAKSVLGSPPEGAPRVDILFLQWASERDERLASLRSQGGSLSVVYEGDVIDGMAVASIHADEILFTWRDVTFRQPVHRY